jgi:glycosyltransferase involved in cell wall biosynthesis
MAILATSPVSVTPLLRRMAGYVPWVPSLTAQVAAQVGSFDVVHGMNVCFESLLISSQDVARRAAVPFILTPLIHLGESEKSIVRRFYTMPHQIDLIRRADAVLAQTDVEIDFLTRQGIDRDQITIAGVGINPADLGGGDGQRFLGARGLRSPLVLYLGTSAYDKGTVHLVQAMQRIWDGDVTDSTASAELVLAGPTLDPFTEFLQKLPPHHRARTHVLGVIGEDEKKDLLDAASMMVMASRTDSFGIVYLESWLYRKPVIGAWAGGIPAVIQDGIDGYLVKFGDVDALASRIRELLTDPSLSCSFGENGRRKLLDRYTWDRIFPVVEEVYERLWLKSKAGRPAKSKR